jgi:spoIIIJ-associated protein
MDAAISRGLSEMGLARDEVDIEVLQEPSRGILGIGAREAIVRLTRRPTLAEAMRAPVATPEPEPAPTAAAPTAPAAIAAEPASATREPAVEAAALADEQLAAMEEEEPAAERSQAPLDRAQVERVAGDALRDLLDKMGFHASVHAHWVEPANDEDEETLILDIQGHDLGVLIGHRGETLTALQYITRLIASRTLESHADIVVDVAGYKARREQQLRRLAQQVATQAIQRHRTMLLEPMPPNERRIIHLTLRDHPQVVTKSVGEGEQRKVTIIPKDLAT